MTYDHTSGGVRVLPLGMFCFFVYFGWLLSLTLAKLNEHGLLSIAIILAQSGGSSVTLTNPVAMRVKSSTKAIYLQIGFPLFRLLSFSWGAVASA